MGARDWQGECQHVFLDGNGLPEAWRRRDVFSIGELGFGCGLNFAMTRALWRRGRAAGGRLHYVAAEAHPLTREELASALGKLLRESDRSLDLVTRWPRLVGGFHRLSWPDEGVFLTLLFGDALAQLRELEAGIDAWYLDGFAPARNPDMWSHRVIAEIARLSRPDATLATYSAARPLREALSAGGFEVRRGEGFGRKRHMTLARYRGSPTRAMLYPWMRPQAGAGPVTVVGAGIAGACVARACADRRVDVTVIDAAPGPAGGASGVGRALVGPRLPARQSLEARIALSGWLHAERVYKTLGLAPTSGLLRLDADPARLRRVATDWPLASAGAALVSAARASALAGIALPTPAILWHEGGTVDTTAIVSALLDQSPTNYRRRYRGLGDPDRTVVWANGLNLLQHAAQSHLPLRARLGQVSRCQATPASQRLRMPIAYGGYVTPATQGIHDVGATYDHLAADRWDQEPPLSRAADDYNLQALSNAVPALQGLLATGPSWAGIRAVLPDHLPLVGPLTQDRVLRDAIAANAPIPEQSHCGWTLSGLGSYGFSLAPLLAELLAAQMFDEPWPAPRTLGAMLHPWRFTARALGRRLFRKAPRSR